MKEGWDQSELNVGYWSEGCEEWYQHCLSDIQEGKAGLVNLREWKAKLKRALHMALFKSNFNVLLQEFTTAKASVLYPPRVIPSGIHGMGGGFHGMVDGFHTFSIRIPWSFQMDSIWTEPMEL